MNAWVPFAALFARALGGAELLGEQVGDVGPVLVAVSVDELLDGFVLLFRPNPSGAHYWLFNQYNKYETQISTSPSQVSFPTIRLYWLGWALFYPFNLRPGLDGPRHMKLYKLNESMQKVISLINSQELFLFLT